jgi:polyhydroxybutyrate depolymerase
MNRCFLTILLIGLLLPISSGGVGTAAYSKENGKPAQKKSPQKAGEAKGQNLSITIDGAKRTFVVFAPDSAKKNSSPLVFAFHGHGGKATEDAKTWQLQRHWPQAIVVYPQALPLVTKTDPAGKGGGWVVKLGEHDDRDLKFFDALLEKMKADNKVDEQQMYATGHSSGAYFTYFLAGQRPDLLAAIAPSATTFGGAKKITPLPVLHIAGEKDDIQAFAKQEAIIEAVKKINHCEDTGKPWHKTGTIFASSMGTPVVTIIHPGKHEFHKEFVHSIVDFFKEHQRK